MIGEDSNDIPNNLMTYISKVVFGKLGCLSVFCDDYAPHYETCVRDYIHVVVSEGHFKALEKLDGLPRIVTCNS